MPSPPISRAKNLPTDASKLPFNMSVTSLRAYRNSGSGKPRYGPPDAPLDSCPLVFARVRYTCEDRDPLTLFILSEWNRYLLERSHPPQRPRHTPQPRPGPVASIFIVVPGSIGRWGGAPESSHAIASSTNPLVGRKGYFGRPSTPPAASRSTGSSRPARRIPPPAPRSP